MLKPLISWFKEHSRDLPWRKKPTPYRVWVSEIMLQQTRASVVIPYFERWMNHFPTLKKLAKAEEEEVVKLWEGLGYYSRARNLLAGAKQVMREFGGEFPQTEKELLQIKGIGPYTVGAILSFAFQHKAAAVDGNVLRVISRFDNDQRDIGRPTTVTAMRSRVIELLPDEEPWVAMEALIELGATLCSRGKPTCGECPLRLNCEAFASGTEETLPVKERKVKVTKLNRTLFLMNCDNHILVRQVPAGEVMAGLYEFPYLEREIEESSLALAANQEWNVNLGTPTALGRVTHGFTRYQATLYPFLFDTCSSPIIEGYQWVAISDLEKLSFSSGHRRVCNQLMALVALGR